MKDSRLFTQLISFALFFVPLVAYAQVTEKQLNDLNVPLITHGNLIGTLVYLLRLFLLWAGIIAFLFVLWGGFTYLTAGGDAAATARAKSIIINAIIGMIIIALSYVLVTFVLNQLKKANGTALAPKSRLTAARQGVSISRVAKNRIN